MSTYNAKVWAIIPAAGIGARMQADCPKQYLTIHHQTLLARVVNLLSAMPEIEKVVVALHPKDHWWSTLSLTHPAKVLTAIGGKERVHSVLLGLQFLADFAADNDFVVVHDAARPCIQTADIQRLLDAVAHHAVGGLLGLPVVDTLKKVGVDDAVQHTVSRDQLWVAQTPQCFRYGVLKNAIEKALSDQCVVTDESSAVEYVGLLPKMVVGSARNIKVTFPEDVALAEKLLQTASA